MDNNKYYQIGKRTKKALKSATILTLLATNLYTLQGQTSNERLESDHKEALERIEELENLNMNLIHDSNYLYDLYIDTLSDLYNLEIETGLYIEDIQDFDEIDI